MVSQALAIARSVFTSTARAGSDARLAVFAIRRDVVYFPSTGGEILWIAYSGSSIN